MVGLSSYLHLFVLFQLRISFVVVVVVVVARINSFFACFITCILFIPENKGGNLTFSLPRNNLKIIFNTIPFEE